MLYILDEKDMKPDAPLAFYRAILGAMARRADRFALRIESHLYDSSEDLDSFLALGRVTTATDAETPNDLLSRLVARLTRKRTPDLLIEGELNDNFVQTLTSKEAPLNSEGGDVSPVEDILLFQGDRRIYAAFDYGRTQLLDLTAEELDEISSLLEEAGLESNRIVPAP